MIKCAQLTVAVQHAMVLVHILIVMLLKIVLARNNNVAYLAFDFGSARMHHHVPVHVVTQYGFAALWTLALIFFSTMVEARMLA